MSKRQRKDVFHINDRPDDQRTFAQRDRDRVLYSSAFRRLEGVTQVVASEEGHIFHNRLTHSLKVAQVGRRLAEKLIDDDKKNGTTIAEKLGGIDPEVVEAAALAHDLGHPPFGHIAEKELDRILKEKGIDDGFEGNAQSFRIVTKLSVRNPNLPGLNLSCATLNALLKYPWLRQKKGKKSKKWGAYRTEEDEFTWARELFPNDKMKSVEAELMDWADDITYAVHDLEDFFRAGLIPLNDLTKDSDAFLDLLNTTDEVETTINVLIQGNNELAKFFQGTFVRRKKERKQKDNKKELIEAFTNLIHILPFHDSYSGTRKQRANLRNFTSYLIRRYIFAIELKVPQLKSDSKVMINELAKLEIEMLKELTLFYVINSHSLATQQHGQKLIIRELFSIFSEAALNKDYEIFPTIAKEQLELLEYKWRGRNIEKKKEEIIRIVVDLISGMTEKQIVKIYHRLTGTSFGSVLDTIIV